MRNVGWGDLNKGRVRVKPDRVLQDRIARICGPHCEKDQAAQTCDRPPNHSYHFSTGTKVVRNSSGLFHSPRRTNTAISPVLVICTVPENGARSVDLIPGS